VVQVPPAGLRMNGQLFAFVRVEVDDVSFVVIYPNYGVNVLQLNLR
jgi:hypothetical protein